MFKSMPATGKVKLTTNLAESALSKALRSGAIRSDIVEFDFAGPATANQGFKPMVREGKFDAGELAIVTFLQAKAWGRPLTLLPATMVGRHQHACLNYDCRKGDLAPKQIEGKRVGVRAWSQTTGVWVRGILGDEYDVDISKVRWATYEDPHVPEYKDPKFLEKFETRGKTMEELMFDGDFDAIIVGGAIPGEARAKTLIPDPANAADGWVKRTGIVPINHLFVVSDEVAKRTDVVQETFRMLVETKKAMAPPAGSVDFFLYGVEPLRKSLETIIRYSYEQQMIPRMMSVDELFNDVTRKLGV